MGSKAAFLLGAGVGYVLGTKAGRARYEQIKIKADHFMQDERVQSAVATAKDKLGDVAGAAGAAVKDKVADTAAEAGEALKAKVSSIRHHDDAADGQEPPAAHI
ncbi:YtxH domain-containing protein [Sanguibacter hominis]|uniref:YtxH domain-containing protein n=1 Tax=Sanguibacter hominis TaxID=1312739 RepID=UPI001B346199|nr:YtxH domain-containing protein [Sanguibacter hominis]